MKRFWLTSLLKLEFGGNQLNNQGAATSERFMVAESTRQQDTQEHEGKPKESPSNRGDAADEFYLLEKPIKQTGILPDL